MGFSPDQKQEQETEASKQAPGSDVETSRDIPTRAGGGQEEQMKRQTRYEIEKVLGRPLTEADLLQLDLLPTRPPDPDMVPVTVAAQRLGLHTRSVRRIASKYPEDIRTEYRPLTEKMQFQKFVSMKDLETYREKTLKFDSKHRLKINNR